MGSNIFIVCPVHVTPELLVKLGIENIRLFSGPDDNEFKGYMIVDPGESVKKQLKTMGITVMTVDGTLPDLSKLTL